MSKLTYIQKRFLINRLKMEKLQRNYNREMLKRYDDLANKLYKEINSWVERYADNEGINVDAAYEILSKDDQKKWSMSLQEFRKKAIEGGYSQELNREYFKSRINRLEHLSNQLYTELVEYAAKEDQHLSDYLKDHYEEAYLRNIYELTDCGSFVVPFDRFSTKQLEQVISKPWLGSNFSKRVWRNLTKKLPDALEKTMSQAVTLGWGTDKIVNAMMKEVGTFARSRMTTLVQTEAAHIAERATDRSFEEMGVKQWEWLATLESHTCLRCGELDGKIFDRDDPNAPICPLHPNCRCTRIPVVEGFKELHRWQRDPITGKGKIEKNMSFAEWKRRNVTPEIERKLKIERNHNSDLKQYERYKTVLGKRNMPKKFADFREMKYNNSEGYGQIKRGYRTIREIDKKEWSDLFKGKTKAVYFEFLQYNQEFSSHALSRFVQRSDITVEQAAEILREKANYQQVDGRKIWFNEGHTFIKNTSGTEVVTYVYRKNPKKDWKELR